LPITECSCFLLPRFPLLLSGSMKVRLSLRRTSALYEIIKCGEHRRSSKIRKRISKGSDERSFGSCSFDFCSFDFCDPMLAYIGR